MEEVIKYVLAQAPFNIKRLEKINYSTFFIIIKLYNKLIILHKNYNLL